MTPPWTEADMELVARYVTRDMDTQERIAFELRMTEDAELAEVVEGHLDVDGWLLESSEAERPIRRLPLRLMIGALIGMAAAVALWFGPFGADPSSSDALASVRIAALPQARTFAECYAELGLPAEARPPSGSLRSGESQDHGDPEAFLKAYSTIEDAAVDNALARSEGTITGTHFTIPIDTPVPISVLIYAVGPDGQDARLFPSEDLDPSTAARAARLSVGRHRLPQPVFRVREDGRSIDYSPGFVRRLSQPELDVFVLVQEDELTPEPIAEIDSILDEAADSSSVAKALRALYPGRVVTFRVTVD